MKKQLLLLVVCAGFAVGSLTAAPASAAAPEKAMAPKKKCCSLGWLKQKAGDAYAWTKAEAGVAKNYVCGKTLGGYNWTKQFAGAHKKAIIITSAAVAVATAACYAIKACNKCKTQKSVNAHEELA